MQTMEEQATDKRLDRLETAIRELRAEQKASTQELRGEIQASCRELRGAIESMQRNLIFGFFSLAGLLLTFAGFQLS